MASASLRCFAFLPDDDDQFALVVNFFGGGSRDHNILIVRDQRILRAIADLGPVWHVGQLAALVSGFLEMLEVIEPDAIEGARRQRQLDFDVGKQMRARCALPFAEGIAVDRDHAVTFDDSPGGLPVRGELQPAHALTFYSAAIRGDVFHAPAAGRGSPRFSRKVLPAYSP
jgi:hypothetical protein